MTLYRHKKRGTEYVLIGYGRMQANRWYYTTFDEPAPPFSQSINMREVAIYCSATDPTEIWVSPREEFEDGRFEVITMSGAATRKDAEAAAPKPDPAMAELVERPKKMGVIPLTEHLSTGKPGETGRREDEDVIEVTPEMIEAGVDELRYLTNDYISPTSLSLRESAISVYRAMTRSRRQHRRGTALPSHQGAST